MTTRLKALLLSFFIVTTMTMTAQNGSTDNFFYNGIDNYEDRDSDYYVGLYNQTFGQEVPIVSGLLVMLAAGAGYVALKKKEA